MDFGRKMLRKKTFAHEQCFLETMNSTREPCIVEASQDLGLDLSGLDRKADARAKRTHTFSSAENRVESLLRCLTISFEFLIGWLDPRSLVSVAIAS